MADYCITANMLGCSYNFPLFKPTSHIKLSDKSTVSTFTLFIMENEELSFEHLGGSSRLIGGFGLYIYRFIIFFALLVYK